MRVESTNGGLSLNYAPSPPYKDGGESAHHDLASPKKHKSQA
ncbi:MAG TPA: hypothetical protein VJA19_05150 [Pseudomonas sp.]|nr:hypothetical protein [Pseudomonas sp.]